MRFLKTLLFLAVIPLLFISCGDDDDPVKPEMLPDSSQVSLNVNVASCKYRLKAVHKSYYDTAYTGSVFMQGLELLIKIDKPAERSNIKRLIIKNKKKSVGYEFSAEELAEIYSDTLGGYRIDFLELSSDVLSESNALWSINIFNAQSAAGKEYETAINYSEFITNVSISASWSGINQLQINLSRNLSSVDSQKIILHYLNSNKSIIGSPAALSSASVNLNDVPNDAFYFYIEITDKYLNEERDYISKVFPIPERIPSNTVFPSGISFPDQIEYLNKDGIILCLLKQDKKIIACNFEFTDKVWSKTFSYTPQKFVYSESNHTIYILLANGFIYAVNAANGSETFWRGSSLAMYKMLLIDHYVAIFDSEYNYEMHDITKDVTAGGKLENLYAEIILSMTYSPETKRLYCASDRFVYNFELDNMGFLSSYRSVFLDWVSDDTKMYMGPYNLAIYLSTGFYLNLSPDRDWDMFLSEGYKMDAYQDLVMLESGVHYAVMRQQDPGSGALPHGSISLYHNTYDVEVAKEKNIAGKPLYIFNKGDVLKVFSDLDGKFVYQDFSVQNILLSAKINAGPARKFYRAKSRI